MIHFRLSSILGHRRIKMTELAKRSGISYPTINRLYHEKTNRIDYKTLDRLCRALNVAPGDLLEFTEEG